MRVSRYDFAGLDSAIVTTIDFERPPDGALVIGLGFSPLSFSFFFPFSFPFFFPLSLRKNNLVDRG